jgi:hypothetical protein
LRLAPDVPAVWQAPETPAQDRQESVRVWVERVTVHGPEDSEHVAVTLPGAGGGPSAPRRRRPVARDDQLATSPDLVAQSAGRRQTGHSFAQRAAQLHRAGLAPPKRPERWAGETVARWWSRHGWQGPRPRALDEASGLSLHASWLADCAREVPMPMATCHQWPRLGWVHSRTVPVASGRWALWADPDALERLRQRRAYQRQWPAPHSPQALTTPQRRDMQPQRACRRGSRVPCAPPRRLDGLHQPR